MVQLKSTAFATATAFFLLLFKFILFTFSSVVWGLPLKGMKDLDGHEVSPSTYSNPSKRKELVFFWATWCGSCAQKLTKDLVGLDAHEDVKVVTINIDTDPKRVKHFVQKRNIQLPVWREEDKYWQTQLNINSVPHWAVFERPSSSSSSSSSSSDSWKLVHSEKAFDWEKIKQILVLQK